MHRKVGALEFPILPGCTFPCAAVGSGCEFVVPDGHLGSPLPLALMVGEVLAAPERSRKEVIVHQGLSGKDSPGQQRCMQNSEMCYLFLV